VTVQHFLTIDDLVRAHRSVEPTEVVINAAVLEAAVASQHAGFGEHEQFPDLAAKAAAVARGVAHGHPFSEGNKRTALLAVHLLARINGHAFVAGQSEAFHLITDLATSQIDVEQAAEPPPSHLGVIEARSCCMT